MGKSFNTGLLTNGIAQDSSNNVGIGGAANASYKLAVTGAGLFTGALTADGAASEGSIKIERDSVAANTVIGSLAFTNNNSATTYGKVFGGRNAAGDGYVALGTGISNNLYALETGNVGIGTTSPAVALNVVAGSAGGSGRIRLTHATSSSQIDLYTGVSDGVGVIVNNNPLWFEVNGTERMRITSSGNLGIGTSTPDTKLQVAATGATGLSVRTNTSGDAFMRLYRDSTIYAHWYADRTNSKVTFGAVENVPLTFDTNGSERMRITSGGNVGIGPSGTASSAVRLVVQGSGTSNAAYAFIATDINGSTLFGVRNDGLIDTGTRALSPYNLTFGGAANLYVNSLGELYRATSSIKYKTDIIDYDKGLDIIKQLRPVYYKSKNDADTQYAGFIAEEVHNLGLTEFVQYADDKTPDALAYSHMVALLTKAIQELNQKVTALENKA